MQITYQKNDGSIIQRYRKTMLPYKIGEMTSMGWTVLNIEYLYKDKYYPEYKYNMLKKNNAKKSINKREKTEVFIREMKTFLYYFIAVIVISYLKTILGIK